MNQTQPRYVRAPLSKAPEAIPLGQALRCAHDTVSRARARLAALDCPELCERLAELEETMHECRLLCGDRARPRTRRADDFDDPLEEARVWRSVDGALCEAVAAAHAAFEVLKGRDSLAAEAARECEEALDLRRTMLSALQPESACA
jgi:hypothetical protein